MSNRFYARDDYVSACTAFAMQALSMVAGKTYRRKEEWAEEIDYWLTQIVADSKWVESPDMQWAVLRWSEHACEGLCGLEVNSTDPFPWELLAFNAMVRDCQEQILVELGKEARST